MAYRNTALRCGAKYRETGCKSPTQKRHCKVYVFSDGAAARLLAGAGKALRKERAKAHAPSQDIRFRLFLAAFPPERMQVHKNVYIKAKKWPWCFFILARRSGTAPFFTP